MVKISIEHLSGVKKKIEKKFELDKGDPTINNIVSVIVKYTQANDLSISPRTLRRIWKTEGKPDDYVDHEEAILNSLVQILDKDSSWEVYRKNLRVRNEKSYFSPEQIKVSELEIGSRIVVGWEPIYFFDLEYLGDYNFCIISSYNERYIGRELSAEAFLIKKMEVSYDLEKGVYGYSLPQIICIQDSSMLGSISENGMYLESDDMDIIDDVLTLW